MVKRLDVLPQLRQEDGLSVMKRVDPLLHDVANNCRKFPIELLPC